MAQQRDPRRILIVDDNQDAADMLAEVLTLHGHVTSTAYGGRQGLSALADFIPDVVLLDLGMPGMDGYQVAAEMRQMGNLRQPLLIAFTAWNDEQAKARIAKAGFDLHLTKTIGFDALLAAVETLMPPANRQQPGNRLS